MASHHAGRPRKPAANLESRMDRALERVRLGWLRLYAAETLANSTMDKMGDGRWRAYCAARGYNTNIDHLFGDLGA